MKEKITILLVQIVCCVIIGIIIICAKPWDSVLTYKGPHIHIEGNKFFYTDTLSIHLKMSPNIIKRKDYRNENNI